MSEPTTEGRELRVMQAHTAAECPDRQTCWAAAIHDQHETGSSSTGPGLDLDTIEARAAAAAQGPWLHQDRTVWEVWANNRREIARVPDLESTQLAGVRSVANAEFIAHAREDVPALVARVRELEAQLAGAVVPRVLTVDEPEPRRPWVVHRGAHIVCSDWADWDLDVLAWCKGWGPVFVLARPDE